MTDEGTGLRWTAEPEQWTPVLDALALRAQAGVGEVRCFNAGKSHADAELDALRERLAASEQVVETARCYVTRLGGTE